MLCDKNSNNAQKSDRSRGFQALPARQEETGGEEFWSDGYFASTVGMHGNESMIGKVRQEPRYGLQQATRRSPARLLLILRPWGGVLYWL